MPDDSIFNLSASSPTVIPSSYVIFEGISLGSAADLLFLPFIIIFVVLLFCYFYCFFFELDLF